MTPKISVLLPAFNAQAYLRESIESILSQTFTDFELILINDRSTDQTLEIMQSFHDPRIRIVKLENVGLSLSLNHGIALAKGEYIARMDADDVSLPKRLEMQFEEMNKGSLDFCGCNIAMMSESGKMLKEVVMPSNPDLILITLACTVPFAHGSVMMRRQFLQAHHLSYEKDAVAEDYDLWCRAFNLGARMGNVNEILFYYRHYDQSLSKIRAKKALHHTQKIRRNFIEQNAIAVAAAIERLLPQQRQLSTRDGGFLLLAAYLLYRFNQSKLLFSVLVHSSFKNAMIAFVKILRGF